MIDLRYHVYSLAAVFFALAIGIVVGSSFAGKPGDRERLQRVSDRYEHNLETMKDEVYKQREDIRAARADAGRNEQLCSALVPVALKSRLLYYNVAIVQTGDYDELTTQLKDRLKSFGANVTSVTRVAPSFDFSDPAAVQQAVAAAGITLKSGETQQAALLRVIADSVVAAGQTEKLSQLEGSGVVTTSGDYKRWNRHVVVVGGSLTEDAKRAQSVDGPLVRRMVGQGAVVVACEPLKARTSYVPAWKRLSIATVDNADRSCGVASLVCALTGEVANFGQKPEADRQIPETLEAQAK